MSQRDVKPFWFDYESEIPAARPEAEDLRDGWRETIREHTRMALGVRRRQGERISGKIPYGYRLEAGQLFPVEEEQAAIRLMMKLRADGLSLRAIAARLKAEGIKRQNGSTDWPSNVVLMILRRAEKLGIPPAG